MNALVVPDQVARIVDRGGLIAINTSGGKDSQAMTIALVRAGIPRHQMVLVHAHLGHIEWPGTIEHIATTGFDLRLIIARSRRSFFDMVRGRGMFPSPKYRQCTSDLKRGPIERQLRRYLAAHPRYRGQIVNAMGMRAEESAARRTRPTLKHNARNSVAGRTWFDWLPIHDMTKREVFQTIADAGQNPHWAYAAGMSRLSCSFCIMSSLPDLHCAARLRPDLLAEYAALEADIGHTLRPDGVDLLQTLQRTIAP